MSRIHKRGNHGRPVCGCHRRWSSAVITTVMGWAKVTCLNCLRMKGD